jgi:pilus assembly protein CpaE
MRDTSFAPATSVVVLTASADFEQAVRSVSDANVDLSVVKGDLVRDGGKLAVDDAAVVVVELDANRPDELHALQGLMRRIGGRRPVIVVTPELDASTPRRLVQMQVADYLVKPVAAVDLVAACAKAARAAAGSELKEAQIHTFLPAVGGAGATTLAIQAALTLQDSGTKGGSSTCLVDLNFEHSACADYLDLKPRLDLDEIEPRPDRLDRQLLEVMMSHHSSGLQVIAAPSRPAEMRSFDFEVVTRLLDLVASHFDNVVIDVPRTWFAWTDSVLIGSNRLFLVTEMTVPGLKHARHLVNVIRERLVDGPRPEVIVNRFEQRLFGPGLRRADIEQALGDSLGCTIPNNFRLVSEAIDRGVPLDEVKAGNNITQALSKLIIPPKNAKAAAKSIGPGERKLVLAR